MVDTLDKLLKEITDGLAQDIVAALPKVTGATAKSVSTEVVGNVGTVSANRYIGTFQEGRRAAGGWSIDSIKRYIQAKGLSIPQQFKNETQFAWAIKINQAKHGNTLYRKLHGGKVNYQPTQIMFNEIFDKRIKYYADIIGKYGVNYVSSELFPKFEQLNKTI
jgi:hypothetical protein